MMNAIFLILILFLSVSCSSIPQAIREPASTASCYEMLKNITRSESSTKVAVEVVEESFVDKKTPQIFMTTVHNINETIGKYLEKPEELNISIKNIGDTAFATQTSRRVTVPERLGFIFSGRTYTKDPSSSIPVLAHEYGHILFYENARKYFEFINLYETSPLELEKTTIEAERLLTLYHETSNKIEKIKLTSDVSLLQKDLEKFEKDYMAVATKKRDLSIAVKSSEAAIRKFSQAKAPYDEFWADIVSVMFTNDPKGIFDSLTWHESINAFDKKTYEFKLKEALMRKLDSNSKFDSKSLTEHTHLSKALKHLWEKYLKKPEIMQRKDEVAPIVLNVIFEQLEKDLKIDDELETTNYVEISDKLILLFDEKLSFLFK